MGLFTKKVETGLQGSLYDVGSQKTILVVGLGNVGKEYANTRHNIGFACVDAFAASQNFPDWIEKKDLRCAFAKGNVGSTSVILVKPTTYMNESGRAVQAVQHFYRILNAQTIVVHDELDLNFGQIRARNGGSHAGNNGIKSIIQHLGDDFARIRIGIKNQLSEKMDGADFVLAKFSVSEKKSVPLIEREVSAMLSEFIATNELPHDTRTVI